MMKEIKPVDYILANRLGYLAGNVVTLLTEWQITRDVKVLKQAHGFTSITSKTLFLLPVAAA